MKKSIILLISIWLTTGCNSWLDLKPEDSRVSDQYWTTAEDVQTTMLSCYSRLRNCLPYFMVWGEVRAESFDVNSLMLRKILLISIPRISLRIIVS